MHYLLVLGLLVFSSFVSANNAGGLPALRKEVEELANNVNDLASSASEIEEAVADVQQETDQNAVDITELQIETDQNAASIIDLQNEVAGNTTEIDQNSSLIEDLVDVIDELVGQSECELGQRRHPLTGDCERLRYVWNAQLTPGRCGATTTTNYCLVVDEQPTPSCWTNVDYRGVCIEHFDCPGVLNGIGNWQRFGGCPNVTDGNGRTAPQLFGPY